MKNILILSNVANGLYHFRKELIERLISEKYNVTFSCNYDGFVPALEALGCKYVATPFARRSKSILGDIKLFTKYWSVIKKHKPDLILTYTIKPNIYGGIIGRIKKIPYIESITGLGTELQNNSFIRRVIILLYKLSLKRASFIFFQNEANKEYFMYNKLINKGVRTEILPGSGVNIAHFDYMEYPKNDGLTRFIFIARIMRDKGIIEFLEAAKEVKKQYPDIIFDIVGGFDEDFTKLIDEHETNEIIKYHGEQDDVHEFLEKSNAIIHPSYHEGLSNVLLEAAATGRPILASNISGCKETFDEGISGYKFEVKNARSLSNTIIKFINLPYSQKAQMGRSGRQKMEREFDRNIVVARYMQSIRETLGI